ncbi:hypothetical protein [Bacillus massilinigeriensis]|uniref:hypothetical protein n=1 Tax=Bacillus mediterraneensis TaxID=1805474 RepID=UPI0008F90CE1|nr:hypothetical protein [Bacillus mediterraneensis]
MKIELGMPDMEDTIKVIVLGSVKQAMQQFQEQLNAKERMTLKEGAQYAGVSINTFKKFMLEGLKVSRPGSASVQLVSHKTAS